MKDGAKHRRAASISTRSTHQNGGRRAYGDFNAGTAQLQFNVSPILKNLKKYLIFI
jgi:hypothetical protein